MKRDKSRLERMKMKSDNYDSLGDIGFKNYLKKKLTI